MIEQLQNRLKATVVEGVLSLYGQDVDASMVTLQETRKEFDGQLTIVVFPFTRFSKKTPEDTAAQMGTYLVERIAEIESFNVIKGFLNLVLTQKFWVDFFNKSIVLDDFTAYPSNGKTLMVEYSSPNTNKPLHLGHIRNNLLGYSVAEILKAYGYKVIKANLVNDRGIHICKSMLAWQRWGDEETPETANMKGDHLVGKYYVRFDQEYKQEIEQLMQKGHSEEEAKRNAPLMLEAQTMLQQWEAGNEEVIRLWKKMNEWVYAGFDQTYNRLGVDFDQFYYESDTYLLGKDIVDEGLSNGLFYKKKDGSVWVDLTDEGLDEKLVLRGDGTAVYITQDLGTAQLKYDDHQVDKSLYVVGNEQDYHFKVLFSILKKLKRPWADGLYHLSYGMVDLPSGKMKSREGTVVDADDLMQEMFETAKARTQELGKTDELSDEAKDTLYEMIGMGALKYFLLKVEPKKRLLFDPNESIDFQGHTGPFIQYTHARIQSVLNRGREFFSQEVDFEPNKLTDLEQELIQFLGNYRDVIRQAAEEYSPAVIASYAFDLAKLYNRFYHDSPIMQAEDVAVKVFRLRLSQRTAHMIAQSMKLLGVVVPDRM